jgi:hypothetical protein
VIESPPPFEPANDPLLETPPSDNVVPPPAPALVAVDVAAKFVLDTPPFTLGARHVAVRYDDTGIVPPRNDEHVTEAKASFCLATPVTDTVLREPF